MNQSTYFNYNLPQPNDPADISKVNTNFTNLDAFLHRAIGENYSDTDTLDARVSAVEANENVLEKSAVNSFSDGIDSYFKKVVSSVVPVQAGSGTPSPTNVRAISGFTECTVTDCGFNCFDKSTLVDGKRVDNTGAIVNGTGFSVSDYILVLPNTTYYLKDVVGSGSWYSLACYDSNETFIQNLNVSGAGVVSGMITTPSNAKYIRVNTYTVNKDTCCVNISDTSKNGTYEPYTGTTATISFGSAGTVYGARVELISGKLVVDRVCVTPTEVIEVQSNNRWNIALTDLGIGGSEGVEYMLSSHFNPLFANTPGSTYVSSTKDRLIAIPTDSSLSTKALADAWLQANNPQFVYKLETPKEYQLTPAQLRSLVGTNNLTSSTGEVTEVEYITNDTIAWLLDLVRAN